MKNLCITFAILAALIFAVPHGAQAQERPGTTSTVRDASADPKVMAWEIKAWREYLMNPQAADQANGAFPGCGPNTKDSLGDPKPIPGDPQGRKGWIIHTQTDDKGNVFEIWCIEIAGGVGNSFGGRYTPKDGTPVWIGRCSFVGGQNTFDKHSTGDTNGNGKPDGWDKISWQTEDDGGGGAGDSTDDDGQPGKKDYHWEYDPIGGKLKRWETLDGRRINPDKPDYEKPAPGNFDDLSLVAAVDTVREPMLMAPAVMFRNDGEPMAVGNDHADVIWRYALRSSRLVMHTPTVIMAGDRISIAASGITAAEGPAGWETVVTPGYTTWIYTGTTPINLNEAGNIPGFMVMSAAQPGTARWIAISASLDGHFNMDGPVAGPALVAASHPAPRMILGSLNAYPNPAHGSFYVEFSVQNTANVTLELYDVDGRLVRTMFNGSTEGAKLYRLGVENGQLVPGTYMLKMMVGEEVHTRKVVVVE